MIAPSNTQTRDIREIEKNVGNIYETVMIIAKRANSISLEMKSELNKKLEEFASYTDNLDEISKFYEKLPKPTSISLEEYLENKLFYRYPETGSVV